MQKVVKLIKTFVVFLLQVIKKVSQQCLRDRQLWPLCGHLLAPSQGLRQGSKAEGVCLFLQRGEEVGC